MKNGITPRKLAPQLAALVEEYERNGEVPVRESAERMGLEGRFVEGGYVLAVIVEPSRGMGARGVDRARIAGIGCLVDAVSDSYMRVLAPVRMLERLSELPDVGRVRPPVQMKEMDPGFGSRVSQSVALTGAEEHQMVGFDGAGVKVAVLDAGFIGLSSVINSGELPGDLHRVKGNVEGAGIETGTQHGVGVAEHVMDMAPGAELYCIMAGDLVDLENAADYIRDNGIKVVNHSVGWVNSSYYNDTGPVTSIVNRSHDVDGVFWAVSAGNDANRHWRGGWYDPDIDDTLNFALDDEWMKILGSYTDVRIFLNWNQYAYSSTDLDLYVKDVNGSIIASSTWPQDGFEDPAEAVGFVFEPDLAPYSIVVVRRDGPTSGLDITIFSFYHNLEHAVASSSTMEPADAHGSFASGAIYHVDYGLQDPPLEAFSSRGPTTDGRPKPEITAPDGTASLTYGSSFGTSFASPTTAGAAALLLQLDPTLDAGRLRDTLALMAVDAGDPGPDNEYGAGKLFLEFEFDSLPAILAVSDVPGDQGLEVEVSWRRSGYDFAESSRPVLAYDIFRTPGTGMRQGRDSVATVQASGRNLYSAAVPTLIDSTAAGGVYYTTFLVRARTAEPAAFFESGPDSGYSVDNLVPPAVEGLAILYGTPGGNLLNWHASREPDLAHYNVYRDLFGGFVPSPDKLVGTTADTTFLDPVVEGRTYFYKVTAVDDAGNEGPAVSGELPLAYALYQNVPNPFNPGTVISFDIPERTRVRIDVYDVAGRLVCNLIDEEVEPGLGSVVWEGRDSKGGEVVSGVYFYRISTPAFTGSRKMILLK